MHTSRCHHQVYCRHHPIPPHRPQCRHASPNVCLQVFRYFPETPSSSAFYHTHHVAQHQGQLCPRHAHLAKSCARILTPIYHELSHQVAQANGRLEHLMEDTERLLSQLEKFPELYATAQQLTKTASHLRKQEPVLEKDTVQAYETAVEMLCNESREQLAKVKELLVANKRAEAGMTPTPSTPCHVPTTPTPQPPAEIATTTPAQPPVEIATTSPAQNPEVVSAVPSHEPVQPVNDESAKRINAYEKIDLAERSLKTSFDQIRQKKPRIYSSLLASRQAFWTAHKMQLADTAAGAADFAKFQQKTDTHQALDMYLVALIKAYSNSNHLELLYALKEDESFASIIKNAAKKAGEAEPSNGEIISIRKAIIAVLIQAEYHATLPSLKQLQQKEQFFQSNGYVSVAEHYRAIQKEFLSLVKACADFDNVNEYVNAWDKEEQELAANQDHFDALQVTQETMTEFLQKPLAKNVRKQLEALNEKKASLKNSKDIENFIQTAQRLIK